MNALYTKLIIVNSDGKIKSEYKQDNDYKYVNKKEYLKVKQKIDDYINKSIKIINKYNNCA